MIQQNRRNETISATQHLQYVSDRQCNNIFLIIIAKYVKRCKQLNVHSTYQTDNAIIFLTIIASGKIKINAINSGVKHIFKLRSDDVIRQWGCRSLPSGVPPPSAPFRWPARHYIIPHSFVTNSHNSLAVPSYFHSFTLICRHNHQYNPFIFSVFPPTNLILACLYFLCVSFI